jgi:hypothetical protein
MKGCVVVIVIAVIVIAVAAVCIINIIIIVVFVFTFIRGIYNYIPETSHVSRVYVMLFYT